MLGHAFKLLLFFVVLNQSLYANWYENYVRALRAIENKDWEIALDYLNEAIAEKSEPEKNARAHGLNFIDYVPYLNRGIVYYHLGDNDNAWLNIRKSDEYGVSTRIDDSYKKLINYKEKIEAQRTDYDVKGESKTIRKLLNNLFSDSKTWAIVIGINDYSMNKNGYKYLPHAVADATAIEKLFSTHMGLSKDRIFTFYNAYATKTKIENLLGDKLPNMIRDTDRLIFYFSGHGETYTTQTGDFGYLIPVDGKKDNLYSTCISMKQISDFSELIPARQILFIIDACYSGIAGILNKSSQGSISKLKKISETQMKIFMESRGRQVMTAGTSKETAKMGKKWHNHSVYTYYLLKGLRGEADYNRDTIVTTLELQVYVNTSVSRDTKNLQNPQLYNLDVSEGQFIFFKEGEF